MKKGFIVPALIGAAAVYFYMKNNTPAPVVLAAPVVPPAPATMSGFGFRR